MSENETVKKTVRTDNSRGIVNAFRGSAKYRRHPKFPIRGAFSPFQLQPVCLAPVFGGETVEKVNVNLKLVSSRLKNSLSGFWHEFYCFYIPLISFDDMYLDLAKFSSDSTINNVDSYCESVESGKKLNYYHRSGINYIKRCLKSVTETYFRPRENNVAVSWDKYTYKGLPICHVQSKGYIQDFLPDEEIEQSVEETAESEQYKTWEKLYAEGSTAFSFSDYMRYFGFDIERIKEEKVKLREPYPPELLGFHRSYQMPRDHYDISTGKYVSNLKFDYNSMLCYRRKRKYLNHPGFVLSLMVLRPKVYAKDQLGTFTSYMSDLNLFQPDVLRSDYNHSVRIFEKNKGVYSGRDSEYMIDFADLYRNGEQFVSVSDEKDPYSFVGNSVNFGKSAYASSEDIASLFMDSGHSFFYDGLADIQFKSRVVSSDEQKRLSFDYKYYSIDPTTNEVKPKDSATVAPIEKTITGTAGEIMLDGHEKKVYEDRLKGFDAQYDPLLYKPYAGALWAFPAKGTTVVPKGVKRKDVPGYIEKPDFRYGE
ncbi:hypothetical protein CKC_03490 [Candidatus Liberibacter solanacearum CLso-ZC1]|uniref:Uncharacterized protein n=1 Tax=Liberibacter solanacearum (strain CLso-ZC1) TaxID=658172 RepID=E4UBE2_LIBSC|nr:hypothetical protein [Candidatus Liberibacter solanacearum]ADR52447.1 hypothetical protein CKC_03490 [Candidatus Liberibacter solanacearum CLso-ZC1]